MIGPLLLFAVALTASAGEESVASASRLTCLGDAELTSQSGLAFEGFEPQPDDLERFGSFTSTAFTGFAARWGVRDVTVLVGRDLPPPAQRAAVESNGALRLVVRIGTAEGARWWRLVAPVDQSRTSPEERLLIRDVAGSEEGVRLATPDRSLPLLRFDYEVTFSGANSTTDVTRTLLIDIRQRRPTPLGLLSCVDHSGGGGCTAPDHLFRVRPAVDCEWLGKEERFRCAWRLEDVRAWGARTRTAVSDFGGGSAGLRPTGYARWTVAGPPWSAPRVVAGIGPVRFLVDLPSSRPGETLRLVASPGRTFTPRLFMARIRAGRVSEIEEIEALPLRSGHMPEELPEDQPEREGTPVDGPTYRVRMLSDGGAQGLRVVQVVASQPEEIDLEVVEERRALLWVAIDPARPPQALLVAGDAAEYVRCARALLPASARSIEILGGPGFGAVVQVEPERWIGVPRALTFQVHSKPDRLRDSEDLLKGPPCPRFWRIGWDGTAGFRQTPLDGAPPASCLAEKVTISPEGDVRPGGNSP
jgi:hypothetical protein